MDTDELADHQLGEGRSTWPLEKNRYKHTKLGRMKEVGGKREKLVGLDLPLVGGGAEESIWSPHQGTCLGQRRNIWGRESEAPDLQQSKWNKKNRTDSPCHSHTYLRQGRGSPRRHIDWKLECSDGGAIPGHVCCWLQGNSLRGREGGDCDGKCLWRRTWQTRRQGNTAESCVAGGAITIASLSPNARTTGSWTIEKLAL